MNKNYPYWYIKFVCDGDANIVEYFSPSNLDKGNRVNAIEFCSREDAKQALAESGYNTSWAPKIVKVIGKKEKAKAIDAPIVGSLWRNCDDGFSIFILDVYSDADDDVKIRAIGPEFEIPVEYYLNEWNKEVKLNGLECVFSPEE